MNLNWTGHFFSFSPSFNRFCYCWSWCWISIEYFSLRFDSFFLVIQLNRNNERECDIFVQFTQFGWAFQVLWIQELINNWIDSSWSLEGDSSFIDHVDLCEFQGRKLTKMSKIKSNFDWNDKHGGGWIQKELGRLCLTRNGLEVCE